MHKLHTTFLITLHSWKLWCILHIIQPMPWYTRKKNDDEDDRITLLRQSLFHNIAREMLKDTTQERQHIMLMSLYLQHFVKFGIQGILFCFCFALASFVRQKISLYITEKKYEQYEQERKCIACEYDRLCS